MKTQIIKFKSTDAEYSILIGRNILGNLKHKISIVCPKAKKISIIFDKKVPKKFIGLMRKKLKKYDLSFFTFNANEKSKSLKNVNFFIEKLLSKKYNRSDLIISVGGGITGDVVGFISSIFKRGINFINIPTTLLAQVDSAIGGKTGVNSIYGKNLIGSFYQPKLVLVDTLFLDSLPKKEMVCGYAEILKHSIIKDKFFFNWLKKNSKKIFLKNEKELIYAIKKSCMIKIKFATRDVKEKGLRMSLNFGHTFAHAIEAKSSYSKNITHGEAVLSGIILETRLAVIRKVCKPNTLNEIYKIYKDNNLEHTFTRFSKSQSIKGLLPYLKNDKKNNDDKINFILIEKIGKVASANKNKLSIRNLENYSDLITQY